MTEEFNLGNMNQKYLLNLIGILMLSIGILSRDLAPNWLSSMLILCGIFNMGWGIFIKDNKGVRHENYY